MNQPTAHGEDILGWLDRAITAREEAAHAVGFDTIETGDYLWGANYLVLRRGDETKAAPEMDGSLADHIALNDPASVLRRCTADRKLIALHQPDGSDCRVCAAPEMHSEDCDGNYEWSRSSLDFPCPTVLALAEGYGWTEGER
ncbi:DUF6221 family protein [Streptomyces sp. NPDC007346]|uniref:DUF6221 family protein n=1 Tax=Streptomyces sp. NPDC007346 TaxID=3154682 RepID=UPI003451259F